MAAGRARAADGLWDESLTEHRARQADEIAATALRIVASDGMSALTMSALAEKAGVSRQTLYRYFPDVDSVLAAAMTSGGMEAHGTEAAPEGTPGERLDAMTATILEAAAAGHPSPTRFEQSLPPQAREAARKHTEGVERLIVGIVEQGVADGSFSAELTPAVDGAILYRLIAAAHDVAAGQEAPAGLIDHVTQIVRRIVAPRDERS